MKKESLEALLDKMTLKEKVGQLVQLSPNFFEESLDSYLTGPMQDIDMTDEDLYTIGSTLNIQNKEQAYNIQKTYLENNRLKIPLLIMADVIHGYKTIFPIPLAIGSSWNPSLVHDIADLSALEASSEGVHITFSPMVDLVRDPRWGRVLESTGEDTYLNSVYAKEFVSGYQGSSDLSDDPTKIASCVKHFIGYGLSEAGRDYNRVDMSDLEMYENHLPAFRSALEAGAKLVMTSFNVIHGIPVTGNKNLLENILRKELDFDGVLISDWNAVGELIPNGVAENHKEAALKSIEAGVDIDMMALSYYRYLEELAKESSEILALINTAVWRVLTLKNELGLFENPFRGFNNQVKMDNHRDKAREIASKTMVLLENDNLLPLKREANIGLIGPFADNHDLLGAWSMSRNINNSVTLIEGMKKYNKNIQLAKVKNTKKVEDNEWEIIQKVMNSSEVLILALGEDSAESGEGASKSDIQLDESQIDLLRKAKETGKKVITILFNGRPLDLKDVKEYSDAILEAWYPGVEAGNAVADIIFGKVNPSGKLSMTFPYSNGQIPVYYNQIRTGRPSTQETNEHQYVSRYLDIPNAPLYPFGYGKSYSKFILSDINQDKQELSQDEEIIFSGVIENISDYVGVETIQLYINDRSAEIARPIKELKDFQQIELDAQEKKEFSFKLSLDDLKYTHSDLSHSADAGVFNVFIGTDSDAKKVGSFKLLQN